jgi:hypothetical protein
VGRPLRPLRFAFHNSPLYFRIQFVIIASPMIHQSFASIFQISLDVIIDRPDTRFQEICGGPVAEFSIDDRLNDSAGNFDILRHIYPLCRCRYSLAQTFTLAESASPVRDIFGHVKMFRNGRKGKKASSTGECKACG